MSGFLFWLGVWLIPFDNFVFAPSLGWASVSPYIFLMSLLLSFWEGGKIGHSRHWQKLFAGFTILMFISLISWLYFGVEIESTYETLIKFALGFSFLLCIAVHRGVDYEAFDLKITKILTYTYGLALFIGAVQYLSILTGFGFAEMERVIFARVQTSKVQFSFTEPSFSSLHVLGVIIPAALIFRSEYSSRLLLIGGLIIGLSVISGSSLRAFVDVLLLVGLFFIAMPSRAVNLIRPKFIVLGLLALSIIAFSMPVQYLYRFASIFIGDGADISDPSAIIRLFRVESAMHGWSDSPLAILIGYGIGGSATAMKLGIYDALHGLPVIPTEIYFIIANPDGLTYSLPVKILVEHGLIGALVLLLCIYKRSALTVFIPVVVSVVQFDSYAFYSIWLYFYFLVYMDGKLKSNSKLSKNVWSKS